MSSQPQFILHIGYPKTGTTTLQNHFFDVHPEIENIGKPFSDRHLDNILLICRELTDTHSDLFDKNFEKHKKQLSKIIHDNNSSTLVLSHEHLCGFWNKDKDDKKLFQRIHDLFYSILPDSFVFKIMLSIRNQQSLVLSSYVEKRFSIFEDYKLEDFIHDGLNNPCDTLVFQAMFFLNKIKNLEKYFDKDQIHILVFEDLKNDFEFFCSNLSGIFGFDKETCSGCLEDSHDNKKRVVNGAYKTKLTLPLYILKTIRKYTGLKLYIRNYKTRMLVKRLLNYASFNLGVKQDQDVQLSSEEKNAIYRIYRNNNLELMQKYGLQLDKYGYV